MRYGKKVVANGDGTSVVSLVASEGNRHWVVRSANKVPDELSDQVWKEFRQMNKAGFSKAYDLHRGRSRGVSK